MHSWQVLNWQILAQKREASVGAPLVALYAIALIGLTFVYWLNPVVALNVGDTYSRAYLRHFHLNERNEQFDFAYTTQGSTIVLPGPVAGSYLVRLRISGWRPDPHEDAILTLRSGRQAVTFPVRRQTATYDMFFPATSGDLVIAFESNLYTPSSTDPRLLGVALDRVEVEGRGVLPPLTTTIQILAIISLLWFFWRRVGLKSEIALLLTSAVLFIALVGLLQARLFITVALMPWIAVLVLLHLILWPLQQIMRIITQRCNLTVSAEGWNWLWGIFGVALLFKAGGALYPHAIFIDEWPHMQRVQMVLQGRFLELYRPGFTSFLGGTVGLEGGYLPYSPLWYLIIAPIHMAGIPIGDAMNGLNALLDVSKGLMIFLITLKTLHRERTALIAAALYHLLPMPYFLMSWGNYPTQFGLWASLVVLTFLALNYQQMPVLREWKRFGLWTGLLALSLLSYTIIGIMTFTMLGILMLVKLLQGAKTNRQFALSVLIGMVLAESFAFAVYHVQFVSVFVNSTLPSVVNNISNMTAAELRPDVEARESPLSNFLANTIFLRNHTTYPLLILAIVGLGGLYFDRSGRRYGFFWSAWLGIFVIYTLVSAYVADMVLKHIVFVVPLVCVGAAVALNAIWDRWRYGRLATIATALFLFTVVVDRWWFYLLIKRHDIM
ncbi:hypothetical protein [Roseiflexus sp.]|uniref:hypothetical protein n=1 Tax=Roseiflexus sp. TaxID=2562120 RepID=UPI00398A9E8E